MTDLPKITDQAASTESPGKERTNIDFLTGQANDAIYFLATAIRRLSDLQAAHAGGASEEVLVLCEHEVVAALGGADLHLQNTLAWIGPEAGWSKQA